MVSPLKTRQLQSLKLLKVVKEMNMLSQVQTANGPVPAQGSSSAKVVSIPKKQSKPEPNHKDKLGRLIQLGDFVAFPQSNSLYVGKIIKLNNKMVKVQEVSNSKYRPGEYNKYPTDCVKLEQSDMTWYILKNS